MRVSNQLTIPIRFHDRRIFFIDSHFEKYYTDFMKLEIQIVILMYNKGLFIKTRG